MLGSGDRSVKEGEPSEGWLVALAVDDLWEHEMVGVRVGEAEVLLVNLGGGDVHAYENRCPHAGARLSEGHLSATTLTCGVHLWEFDARTGAGQNPRNCQLRRYPVKIEGGAVMVRVR
jgi:toluene monooxygenase system ferredoxin subunit